MAENVSALGAQRMVLQGLPQRLIQDGLVDEKTMTQAMTAAKEANANLVSHLVTHGIANAREIASDLTAAYVHENSAYSS